MTKQELTKNLYQKSEVPKYKYNNWRVEDMAVQTRLYYWLNSDWTAEQMAEYGEWLKEGIKSVEWEKPRKWNNMFTREKFI